MFIILPYLWMLFMVAAVVATIVVSVMNRPKRKPAPAIEPMEAAPEDNVLAEPSLDFGDELAQMEK